MGVCLNEKCIKGHEKINNNTLNINIKEKIENDNNNNIKPDTEENQINFDENELTKKNVQEQNQNNLNQNQNEIIPSKTGVINYKLESRFKTKVFNFSQNGHISSKTMKINNDYSNYDQNKENFEKLIHFTDCTNKKKKTSDITNTKTK